MATGSDQKKLEGGTLIFSVRSADAVQLPFEKKFAVWFAVRLRFQKNLRCSLKMVNTGKSVNNFLTAY
jgi:hypothetical protein